MREETVVKVSQNETGLTIYLGVPDENFRRFFHLSKDAVQKLSGVFNNYMEGKNVEFTES